MLLISCSEKRDMIVNLGQAMEASFLLRVPGLFLREKRK